MPPWHPSTWWGLHHSWGCADGGCHTKKSPWTKHRHGQLWWLLPSTGISHGVHPPPLLHPGIFRSYCALPRGNMPRLCRNEANGTFPSWERPPTPLGCQQGSAPGAAAQGTETAYNRWVELPTSLCTDHHPEHHSRAFWVSAVRDALGQSGFQSSSWLRLVMVTLALQPTPRPAMHQQQH